MKATLFLALLAATCVILACAADKPATSSAAPSPPVPASTNTEPSVAAAAPASYPGLHNLVTYAPGLVSGSMPEGDEGFDALQAMGIKTIISVDGAQPEVEMARARGMRYIHLPIGYNGMDEERTLEIARAVELAQEEGPVYIHCHHGKHRSAGAAGAAAVTLGLLTTSEATDRMKVSGTSPSYTGLYQCVAVAQPASRETLDAVRTDFPETWKTTGMVRGMVEIEQAFDQLKAIEAAGWNPPRNHPDLVPVAEAGHLADLFRSLCDDAKTKGKPRELTDWLLASSQAVTVVEDELAAGSPDPHRLSEGLKVVTASCRQCHAKYRD